MALSDAQSQYFIETIRRRGSSAVVEVCNYLLTSEQSPNHALLIQIIKDAPDYEQLQPVFQLAINNNIVDRYSFECFFNKLKTLPNINIAYWLLSQAKITRLVTRYHYNIVLDNLCQLRLDVDLAFQLLAEANLDNQADAYTYNTVLNILIKRKVPGSSQLAFELLQQAERTWCTDICTYNLVLKIFSLDSCSDDLEKATSVFNAGREQRHGIDAFTCSYFMNIIVKNNPPKALDLMRPLFGLVKYPPASMYAKVIDFIAESKAPDVDLAWEYFVEAKCRNLASIFVYSTMIKAIALSKTPNIDLALKLLEEAQKAKLANQFTYGHTLQVFINSNQRDLARATALFEEAKMRGFATDHLLSTYLHLLSLFPKEADASRILELYADASPSGEGNKFNKYLARNASFALEKAEGGSPLELAVARKFLSKAERVTMFYQPPAASKLNVNAKPFVPRAASLS